MRQISLLPQSSLRLLARLHLRLQQDTQEQVLGQPVGQAQEAEAAAGCLA